MTYNQEIQLFRDIAADHKQIKTFGSGEEWEMNTVTQEVYLKAGVLYPLLYAVPIQTITTENTIETTFMLICCGKVFKDKTNEDEVLSDCRSILIDIHKILREHEDVNVVSNNPMIQFKEDYGDWVAGWRQEVVLQSDLNNNPCDMPYES